MLKKALIGVAVLLGALAVVIAVQPGHYRVERSGVVAASPAIVYEEVRDFRAWEAWSPWEKLDPNMTKTYEGEPGQVGSRYVWQGNDDVGKGSMTIIEATPEKALTMRLEFIEPFASVAENGFTFTPRAGGTEVRWWMEGDNNFMAKAFGLFMDMDTMIGADFERGLEALAQVSEAKQKQHDAEAQAQAEAAELRPVQAEATAPTLVEQPNAAP